MDVELFDMVQEQMPKMNRALAEGFAVSQMKTSDYYIDKVWRQAEMSFPPGLKYLGYSRPSPAEEFRIVSSFGRQTKKIYDIARSDVYLVQYRFSLNGEEVKDAVYVFRHYVGEGGIMTIKNSKYVLSPVIADIALSVCSDSIFIMLNRAKLTFRKTVGYMNVDGVNHSPYLVYSQIYNSDSKSRAKNNITTLAHYLFCKYGFKQTFRNIGVDVEVITRKDYSVDKYPPEDWVFCTTAYQNTRYHTARKREVTNLVVLVPRAKWSLDIESMVASFFFVVDKYPSRITINDYDHPMIWMITLGKLLSSGTESEHKIIQHMETHMASVSDYIDNMGREILIADGYREIENIFDLMYLLIKTLPVKIAQAGKTISSLYGKRLMIHRYVNEDITQGISRVLFEVQKEHASKKGLTMTELRRIFKTRLPYSAILQLNSGKAFVKSVSTASDCLIHKVTSVTTLQTECGKRASSKKGPTFGEAQFADASIAELGGITNLPDRDPTGRSSLNTMATTDPSGTLVPNPQYADILSAAQDDIRR
jgi:hypothetical protein